MDPVAGAPRKHTRIGRALGAGVALASVAVVSALWSFQERLIYPAPRYAAGDLARRSAALVALDDPALPESVIGFYRGPPGPELPQELWLTFGGNGDLALRWDPLLAPSASPTTAFLMVEYPGYGARAGKPTPETLLTGAEVTLHALAHRLGVSNAELEARSSVLGYSIGGAAALSYAARHPVRRVILVSPFTSMLDMARQVVGTPLCHLLRHRYDNLAALRAILSHGQPRIDILHGARDSFIPPRMGQALAAAAPGSHFELVPDAEHGDVIDLAAPRLRQLLNQPF